MRIKKLSFLMCFILGIIAFGNENTASANVVEVEENILKNLPEGVERYYPKNPEKLVDLSINELKDNRLNNVVSPYAIGEYLPKKVFLTSSDTNKSTSRITIPTSNSLYLYVDAQKFGPRGTLVFTLFREGKYYQSYIMSKVDDFRDWVQPLYEAEWSLRLYCGNPDELEKGCTAEGALSPDIKL